MKKILLLNLILNSFNFCFSQDEMSKEINNANRKIEINLESRNEIISDSEMVSFIDFYFINNKLEGNWMRMRKGNWFHFFQYPHDISEPTSWEEWYKFYTINNSLYYSPQIKNSTKNKEGKIEEENLFKLEYKGDLIDGKPNGIWEISFEKDIFVIGNFKKGIPDGEWKYYKIINSNKILEKLENYKDGKPNGEWIEYLQRGEVLVKENFKDGMPDGEKSHYYKNKLISKFYFYMGLPQGEFMLYDNKDEYKFLKVKCKYNNGDFVELTQFKNDKIIRKIIRIDDNNFVEKFYTQTIKNGKLENNFSVSETLINKEDKNFEINDLPSNFNDYSIGLIRYYIPN